MPLSSAAAPRRALVLGTTLALLGVVACSSREIALRLLDGVEGDLGPFEPRDPPPDAWSDPGYAPSWGQRFPLSPEAARQLLKVARPHEPGPLASGLALCVLSLPRGASYDLFADPDLTATLTLGQRPPLVIVGGEDTRELTFTAPGVTVAPGDRWHLAVVDRDVTTEEPIGEDATTYNGHSPLILAPKSFRVACDLFTREAVEPFAVQALRDADRILSSDAIAKETDPNGAFKDAQRQISDAAALLSWRDYRVQQRVERLGRLERAREKKGGPGGP
jgi:hypothetical protein